MRVSLRLFGLALFLALAPAAFAWRGHWLAALAAAVLASAAAAALVHQWTVAPLEEIDRGLKRWILCDLEVPLDLERMASWPALEDDFRKAQAAVSRALQTRTAAEPPRNPVSPGPED